MYTQFRLAQVFPEGSCGVRRSVQCATSGHRKFGTLSTKVTGEHGRGKFFIKITLHNILVSLHVSLKITYHTFNEI